MLVSHVTKSENKDIAPEAVKKFGSRLQAFINEHCIVESASKTWSVQGMAKLIEAAALAGPAGLLDDYAAVQKLLTECLDKLKPISSYRADILRKFSGSAKASRAGSQRKRGADLRDAEQTAEKAEPEAHKRKRKRGGKGQAK